MSSTSVSYKLIEPSEPHKGLLTTLDNSSPYYESFRTFLESIDIKPVDGVYSLPTNKEYSSISEYIDVVLEEDENKVRIKKVCESRFSQIQANRALRHLYEKFKGVGRIPGIGIL